MCSAGGLSLSCLVGRAGEIHPKHFSREGFIPLSVILYQPITQTSWEGVNSVNGCANFAVRMSMRPSHLSCTGFICCNSLFDVFLPCQALILFLFLAVSAVNVRCHFYLFSHLSAAQGCWWGWGCAEDTTAEFSRLYHLTEHWFKGKGQD